MEWIKVEDRLPEGAEYRVIGYHPNWGVRECWFNGADIKIGLEPYDLVTHWMPLPEPPEDR